MQERDNDTNDDDYGKHPLLNLPYLAEDDLDQVAKGVAQTRKSCAPQDCTEQIEEQEALPGNRAHADHQGAYYPEPIEKADRENHEQIMAVKQPRDPSCARLKRREMLEDTLAEPPTQKKVALVSEKTTDRGSHDDKRELQIPSMRREPREREYGLTFEHRSNQNDSVPVCLD